MFASVKLQIRDQSGFSMVELMVVVIIISIIAAFAIFMRGSAKEQLTRQNVSHELKNVFERARFDSVKRRPEVADSQARVVVNETYYTLTTDRNQDGVLDSTDEETTSISTQNVVIAGNGGISLPVTIVYDRRGEATATDSSGQVDPVFLVCNSSCDNVASEFYDIVLVTPTGTVNLLPGGSSVPTFSAPAGLSNVSASNSINNSAVVTPLP